MMNDNFDQVEEILKSLGYQKKSNNNDSNDKCNCTIDPSGGADNNCCAKLNLDVPGGFQDLDPMIFVVIAELIGNVIAGNTPFNVANSISNILGLVGQVIETYAAQQQYFEFGPGRYYNEAYKNVANPFCINNPPSSSEDSNNNSNNDIQMKTIVEEITRLNYKIMELERQLEKKKG